MDETKTEYRIPLGLCKQVIMKLDSAMTDVHEIAMDDDIDDEGRELFRQISETLGAVAANVVNFAAKELGEEDFLAEDIAMDKIDSYPGDDVDLMDQEME